MYAPHTPFSLKNYLDPLLDLITYVFKGVKISGCDVKQHTINQTDN